MGEDKKTFRILMNERRINAYNHASHGHVEFLHHCSVFSLKEEEGNTSARRLDGLVTQHVVEITSSNALLLPWHSSSCMLDWTMPINPKKKGELRAKFGN